MSLYNGSNIQNTIIEHNNTVLGSWFLTFTMLVLFIYIIWAMRRDFPIQHDYYRSIFIASIVCLWGSSLYAISGWSVTILPIGFYGSLTFIFTIIVYNLKTKNL